MSRGFFLIVALLPFICSSAITAEPPHARNGEKLIITNDDGFSAFYSGRYSSEESLRNAMLRFKDTQVAVLEWCVLAGSRVNFPSKSYEMIGAGMTEFPRRGDQKAAETYRQLADAGVDTLKVVIDACHDAGVQCYASLRMNGDYNTNWMGESVSRFFNSSFWWEHPELRVRGQKGEDRIKLSYAFPEVREFRLNLLREVAARDIDGVNLDFLRHPPFLGYEEPLVKAFQEKYGEDPRQLPTDDPRWLELIGGTMTGFVTQVRSMLDEVGKAKGRHIGLSARVDWKGAKGVGCDVDRWLESGLLDYLVVAGYGKGGYEFDISPFVQKAKASGCAVLFGEEATLAGHDTTPEEDKAAAEGKATLPKRQKMSLEQYRERAAKWYAAGADGIHLFNETDPAVLKALGSVKPATAPTGR